MSQQFRLQSKYQPTGDQPSAIAQLIDGLEKGEREQTLLGVTGSGKSVVGGTKVLLERNGVVTYTKINQLDTLFTTPLSGLKDETQVRQLDGSLKTVAFQPDNGTVSHEKVTEISRHLYNGALFRVTTSCGRENTFTDSHNVYVLRDGEITLLPSSELREGDRLPIPDSLPDRIVPLEYIDTRHWLSEDLYYVAPKHVQARELAVLNSQKAWRVQHADERVTFSDYKQWRRPLREAREDLVSSNKRAASIPVILPLNRELLRIIGLFIAEGCVSQGYVTLSTADVTIAKEFTQGALQLGLPLKKRLKAYDYQLTGRAVTELFKNWCGAGAANKHLPTFWPQCDNQQLGQLLSGIFAGDGWVQPGEVCLASVSHELVSDIQCALLRFGIHARVRAKKVVYKGELRSCWTLIISGGPNLRKYASHVGFGLQRKDNALRQLVDRKQRANNTNVDVFSWPYEYIANLARKYGVMQHELADSADISRSAISMYYSGKRLPARHTAIKIMNYLIGRVDAAESEQLRLLRKLAQLYWSPIHMIETRQTAQEIVYDLSVPSHQTFLAGSYFVHNTYTMANIIQDRQVPTLVLAHNKTLAAQLYSEFKAYFPDNEVHYFVSYFDYYQPEAYISSSDTYIEKDSKINDEIDRLRHAATTALLTRCDTIIVASVSCIYGIGSPDDYAEMSITVTKGERRQQDKFVRLLTDIQYQRNDIDFHRGTFRVKGDVVDVFPAGSDMAYRIEFFGDDVDRITQIDPLTGEILRKPESCTIFPSSHYVTPKQKLERAIGNIKKEFAERVEWFEKHDKLLEAQRLSQRTKYDIEMLEETGFVKGIENYSRYLTNREPGEQPATLLDYFSDDFLLLVDESHQSLPQVRGMYNGDRARKEVLVEHGFRLPSAMDNRPLTFAEFDNHIHQAIYVSATPGDYELAHSPEPAQQIIRPTGLLDPQIIIRPTEGQIDDLIAEINDRINKNQRVLVTTLTKRMAEDLTTYLLEIGIKTAYIHSEVDTLERGDILRDLRMGVFDVLVGINLLREGLDLPEVSMVAIMDADKEGFLRSESALIQTIGRAARHENGTVFMYADRITRSMQAAIDETNRRRSIQEAYNNEHGITPTSIATEIGEGLRALIPMKEDAKNPKPNLNKIPKDEYPTLIRDLSSQMELASANLEFEKAAKLRDTIAEIRTKL